MVKFKKIKLFTKANICYCDVIIDNKQIEIILHFDIILKYQLKDKIEVTIDTYNNILYDNNLLKAKNLSYTFATYKMRTELEIRDRLKRENYRSDIIDLAIKFLYEFNLINDEKYTKLFVEEKSVSKVWGKIRIKNELSRKGVDSNLIDNTLLLHFPETQSNEKAIKAAEKKYNILLKKHSTQKSQQLLFSFLQRKGFYFDEIKEIINKITN